MIYRKAIYQKIIYNKAKPMKTDSLKTPLFKSHESQGARFVDFAGWKMPLVYTRPMQEHLNVRKNGGLFDVSHMGEIRITGKDSLPFLQKILPTDTRKLKTGEAQYSVFCNENGCLIDDLIVYALSEKEDYLLCVNAIHKDKDLKWIESQNNFKNLKIEDQSQDWGLIAVQGPKSFALIQKVFPSIPLSQLKRFHFLFVNKCLFSRTGYTGEEGLEIYIPWDKTESIWSKLLEEGKAFSISPIGLGARDTLRIEMGYLLAGQDFNTNRTPFEAGLSWLLKNPENYIGKNALETFKQSKMQEEAFQVLKGFVTTQSMGIPRQGQIVFSEKGERIGEVTSGAKSPSLEKMIGMAYIKGQNEKCLIEIHDSRILAEFVDTPFLNRV